MYIHWPKYHTMHTRVTAHTAQIHKFISKNRVLNSPCLAHRRHHSEIPKTDINAFWQTIRFLSPAPSLMGNKYLQNTFRRRLLPSTESFTRRLSTNCFKYAVEEPLSLNFLLSASLIGDVNLVPHFFWHPQIAVSSTSSKDPSIFDYKIRPMTAVILSTRGLWWIGLQFRSPTLALWHSVKSLGTCTHSSHILFVQLPVPKWQQGVLQLLKYTPRSMQTVWSKSLLNMWSWTWPIFVVGSFDTWTHYQGKKDSFAVCMHRMHWFMYLWGKRVGHTYFL